MHTSGLGRGDEVEQPRGRGQGEAVEQQRKGARGDAVRKRPGRGRGQAAKSRRKYGVPKTGTYGAKQEGAAETKQQQNAEEGVPLHRTGSSRAEQAAGAAAPRTGASGDKWLPDAPDGRIRAATRSTPPPPDWIIRGQAGAERHGLDHRG